MRRSAKPCTLDSGCEPIRRDPLSPTERLDEVARLLALGFLRLHARRRGRGACARVAEAQAERANDLNHLRSFGLDFVPERSVSATEAYADRERP
jgi:hypothetical protein